MSCIEAVGLDKKSFTDNQWSQVEDQFNFLDETLETIFKTTFEEALRVRKVITLQDKILIVELESSIRDLIPALDIKMIGFQSRKKVGLKQGQCVVILKEAKNG